MTGMRRLGTPKPISIQAGPDGIPTAVGRTAVEAVAEEWVVEDRWWTGRPLKRRYFELILADGRSATVFRDLRVGGAGGGSGGAGAAGDGHWFSQVG